MFLYLFHARISDTLRAIFTGWVSDLTISLYRLENPFMFPIFFLNHALQMITGIAFYPSLGYNLLRNYVQPQKWAWYNRIDETLIVGAMPFKSMQTELIQVLFLHR